MRRRLLQFLPELAHWFGIRPVDVDELTVEELNEFLDRLRKLPPVGGVVQYQPRK